MRNTPRYLHLKLDEILRLVEQATLGLPDFQRRFEWRQDQVRSLLASMFMGWPAGSILLMEAPPSQFFAVRPLEGLAEQGTSLFRHLILDGQQRVTAIAQAFGVSDSDGGATWYLDVRKFERGFESGDIEDAFVRARGVPDPSGNELLVPVAALRNAAKFEEWREASSHSRLLEDHDMVDAREHLNRVWVNELQGLRSFEFPCSVLPAEMPLSSVATIFEKLNTSGLPLDTFDLVVAHVYKDGHNLRAIWEAELVERPILRHFAPHDPLLAAELVAMVKLGDTRRSGLLNLDPEVLWSAWPDAIEALEVAARFLSERAGITTSSQLPHRGILLALAGAAHDLDGLDLELTDLFLYWIYSRGMTERFNAAVNTRTVSERRVLVRAARGQDSALLAIDRSGLIAATRRANSSVWLTVQAMIRRLAPPDFPDGLVSTPLASEGARAISLLRGAEGRATSDRALGIVLGSPRTELLFQELSLREVKAILLSLEADRVEEYVRGQFLPALESRAWRDSGAFVLNRSGLFISAIESLAPSKAGPVRRASPLSDLSGDGSPNVDLVQGWLADADDNPGNDSTRIEIGKRIAEDLLSQGRPVEAVAALQLILERADSWTPSERIGVNLLQVRALSAAGLIDQAITVADRARREAVDASDDSELSDWRPHVLAEFGSLLTNAGRINEGVQVLHDAITALGPDALNSRLGAEVTLEYARGLYSLGDLSMAIDVLRTLVDRRGSTVINHESIAERAKALLARIQETTK